MNTPIQTAAPADYPLVNDVVDDTNVIGLNLLAEGTDYTNRISRKVHVTSLQFRGIVGDAGADTSTPASVRLVCVYDLQPNGAVPAISDILDLSTVVLAPVIAPMNLNNRDRFRVVFDKLTVVDNSFSYKNINIFKHCNYETIYNASSAGVATVTSGALWFFGVSNIPTAGEHPIFKYSSEAAAMIRIRFVDG